MAPAPNASGRVQRILRLNSASVALSLALGFAAAGASAATCPLNTLQAGSSSISTSDRAQTLSDSHVCPAFGGSAHSRAAYDLAAGSCSAAASSSLDCLGAAEAS